MFDFTPRNNCSSGDGLAGVILDIKSKPHRTKGLSHMSSAKLQVRHILFKEIRF